MIDDRFNEIANRTMKGRAQTSPGKRRARTVISIPYEVGYFAKKHDISREQARELMRQIGTDQAVP